MKFNNSSKFSKFSKINKSNPITNSEKPKINKYDVLFDLNHLENLMKQPVYYQVVPEYINKFFFKYGDDIFYDNGETFELLTKINAKNRIPSNYTKDIQIEKNINGKTKIEIKKFSLSQYFDFDIWLKTNDTKLTIDYNKDFKFIESVYKRGFEVKYNFLNMKKDLPRDYSKDLKFNDEIKDAVKLFFNHIKEIICSNDDDEYDTTIKFLASSCAGWKVRIALIWNSLEQSGKGSVLNYLKDLLGDRMFKTSSIENVEKYTKGFEGRTLINLDELPVSGTSKILQDSLKALITEPHFDCRAMYNQGYEQKNTFNIIITSNNNSISLTQSNNIRYFVNTISDKYAGNKNTEYFKKLHKNINKEEVKIAIFKEFMNIFETQVKPFNWLGTDVKPTKSGTIKRIDALPNFIKYIKNNYLLNGDGINEDTKTFILEYQANNPKDRISNTSIGIYLKQLNVDCKKIDNKEFKGRKYIASFETLKEAYINNNWLLDTEKEDIEEINDGKEEKPKPKNSPLDNGISLEPDYKKLYFELLEKQKETPKQVQKTEEITEDDVEALEKELNDVCNDFKPKQQEEKVYLTLPFTSKEDVKRNGAIYDSNKKEWYVLKTNPKFKYLTGLFNSKNVIKTRKGLEFVMYNIDTKEFKFIEECRKELVIIDEEEEDEPEPKSEPENNFNEDDINDILGFIENTKKNKKSKKSRK